MVSFNGRQGLYYKFQATLSAPVCYCITADQTLSLHFIVGCSAGLCSYVFYFYDSARINGRQSSFLLFHQKYSHNTIHK
jgi:hypothetical protein